MPSNSDFAQLFERPQKLVKKIDGVLGPEDADCETDERIGYTEKEYSALEKAAEHKRQEMLIQGLEKALERERANLARLKGQLPPVVEKEEAPPSEWSMGIDVGEETVTSIVPPMSGNNTDRRIWPRIAEADGTYIQDLVRTAEARASYEVPAEPRIPAPPRLPINVGDFVEYNGERGQVLAINHYVNSEPRLRVRLENSNVEPYMHEVRLLSGGLRYRPNPLQYRRQKVVTATVGDVRVKVVGVNPIMCAAIVKPLFDNQLPRLREIIANVSVDVVEHMDERGIRTFEVGQVHLKDVGHTYE